MGSMDEKQAKLTSDEDVDEILKLALRQQGHGDSNLRQRLSASAEELGISEDALQRAEEAYLEQKDAEREFVEFRRRQRREFRDHLFMYLTVNAFLVGMNFYRDGEIGWAVWPILGWGIGVACHAWQALNSQSEPFQEEFEKFKQKRRHGGRRWRG